MRDLIKHGHSLRFTRRQFEMVERAARLRGRLWGSWARRVLVVAAREVLKGTDLWEQEYEYEDGM